MGVVIRHLKQGWSPSFGVHQKIGSLTGVILPQIQAILSRDCMRRVGKREIHGFDHRVRAQVLGTFIYSLSLSILSPVACISRDMARLCDLRLM